MLDTHLIIILFPVEIERETLVKDKFAYGHTCQSHISSLSIFLFFLMPLSCRYSCPSVKTTTAVSADEPRSPSTFCVPQSSLDAISVPSNFVPFHAAVKRKRDRALRRSGARTECHRCIIIVAPASVDQIRPSRRAIIITTTSSSKSLKNPSQCRNVEGDRRRLP